MLTGISGLGWAEEMAKCFQVSTGTLVAAGVSIYPEITSKYNFLNSYRVIKCKEERKSYIITSTN